jgi:hypothetical protein
MNGVLLWIGSLLVAVLGALFAGPHFVDWNSYRGLFEEEASRFLGREVRVGGDVNLRLLPAPYVSFGRVRIADADGGVGEPFFRAESFTLWLSAAQLLKGIVEANHAELNRPVLHLRLRPNGSGNWQAFEIRRAALPFVPNDVALQSVKITQGLVVARGMQGQELARLADVTGEFSAEALRGPFKFRGELNWGGEPRDVRVNTASPEADGSIRAKVTVRAPKSGNSYTLDGRLTDIGTKPAATGDLIANLPIAAGGQPADATRKAARAVQGDGHAFDPNAFDVRAKLTADINGFRLEDLAMAFEQEGKPQLVSGTVEGAWRDGFSVKASLASRWLDLDRIAGPTATRAPLEAIHNLVSEFASYLPSAGQSTAGIAIDQVNLGGDVVSNVRLGLEQTDGALSIKEFKASMPGGTRVDIRGRLTSRDKSGADKAGPDRLDGFDGEVLLRGASLGRFAAWAAKGYGLAEPRSDGAFLLSARLNAAPTGLDLREATVEIAGTAVTGEMGYRWGGRRQLTVALQGEQLDLSFFVRGLLDPTLARQVLHGEAQSAPAGRHVDDVMLRLRAGLLRDGERELRNVDADVSLQNGVLRVPQLAFETPGGLRVEMEGEVGDINAKPSGALRGVVAAKDRAGAATALEFVGIDNATLADAAWLSQVTPLRLAYVMRFGEQGGRGLDISLDGVVRDNRLLAALTLAEGFEKWRDGAVDAQLTIEASSLSRLARTLLPAAEVATGAPAKDLPGRLFFKAAGSSGAEIMTLAQLNAPTGSLRFEGRAKLPKGGESRLDGELRVATEDLGSALASLGATRRPAADAVGLDGLIFVAATDKSVALVAHALSMGGTAVGGTLGIVKAGDRRRFDARLTASEASLPRLIGVLLDGRVSGAAAARAAADGNSMWPEEPFELANVDGITGKVQLDTPRLMLPGDAVLRNAAIEIDLAPGRVNVTRLAGTGTAGVLSSAFRLEKATVGATLTGSLKIASKGLETVPFGPPQPPGAPGQAAGQASGQASLAIEVSGRALSPRAMMTALAGKGEVSFDAVRLPRLSPSLVDGAADAMLTARADIDSAAVQRALRTAMQTAALDLGTLKVPVEIADGALRVKAFAAEAADGRIVNQTTVDLASLHVDSEWRIEPKRPHQARGAPSGRGGPLPGVSIVYVGPLTSLAAIEPRIVSDALERELAVRRMERDVDDLERLRRIDRDRARSEAERLKALQNPAPPLPPGKEPQPRVIEAPLPVPGGRTESPGAPAAAGAGTSVAADVDAAQGLINAAPPARPARPPPPRRPTTDSPFRSLYDVR